MIINRPYCLLNSLFESPTDTHDLTDTLHAAAEESADTAELLEVPAWHLDDDIVQARLKASAGHFRYGIFDFVQRHTKTKLSSDEGKGVTRGFRSER